LGDDKEERAEQLRPGTGRESFSTEGELKKREKGREWRVYGKKKVPADSSGKGEKRLLQPSRKPGAGKNQVKFVSGGE